MGFEYAPSGEKARQNVMVGVAISMTTIGVACVGLRVYTRAFVVRNLGRDDWTIMTAATFMVVLLLELLIGASEFKIGFSGSAMTPSQMIGNVKLTLAIIVVYKMIVTLIKISILMMYLRIAANNTFEWMCKGTIYLLITYQFIVTVVVPAQCTPISKLWDFTGQEKGHCINANSFYLVTSVFHILMDIWILVLPIKPVLSISRSKRENNVLLAVFVLGVFSTIASIVRLQFLVEFTRSSNPFYDALPINTWSTVEVSVGIVCASLPTLRPLFSKSQRDRTREALGKGCPRNGAGGGSNGIELQDRKRSFSVSSMTSGKRSMRDEELGTRTGPPPVPPKDLNFKIDQPIISHPNLVKLIKR